MVEQKGRGGNLFYSHLAADGNLKPDSKRSHPEEEEQERRRWKIYFLGGAYKIPNYSSVRRLMTCAFYCVR